MSPKTSKQIEEIRAQSREKIIASAMELFANHGFYTTSIANVAKEAGISKGLIYNYFESKEELLKAIFEDVLKKTGHLFHFDDTLNSRAQLIHIAQITVDFMVSNQKYMRLFLTLILQPKVVKSLKPWLEVVDISKKEALMPLFKEVFHDKAEEEYFYFGAIMDGMGMGLLTLGDEYPLEAMLNKLIQHINTSK